MQNFYYGHTQYTNFFLWKDKTAHSLFKLLPSPKNSVIKHSQPKHNYVVGTQNSHLNEMFFISTQNTCLS